MNRTIKLPAYDVLLSQDSSTSHAWLWWHPQFTRLKGARWGPWGMMVHSDTEVFPLLQLPRGELYSEVGHCTQAAVALWSQGILGDVKLLQGFCSLNLLHLDIHDVVVVGVDGLNLGQPEHHRGEVHIGVVTEVEALQLHTVCQLLRQLGHLVVGYIQLCYKTKLEGELGRDLGQQVPGEVARGERGVSHQVEDSVRHLTQLALTQVKVASVLLHLPTSRRY